MQRSSSSWRIFVANYLGLIFEAYDLTIYSLLVTVVSKHFHVPVWYGFLVLTMTYVFRGVGGLIFGNIGDKIGRRNALVFTVLGYSICTALTGLSWGILSLIVFRGLTGLFIGGEYVGYSYTMEAVQPKQRGLFSGLIVTSYSVGFLLASVTFGVLVAATGGNLAVNGWRYPFFVGILPALIALWMRLGVEESAAWTKAKDSAKKVAVPLFEIFKKRYLGRTIHAWLVMAGIIWGYDVLLLGLPRMLTELKFPNGTIATIAIITNVGSIAGALCGGWLSQTWGRKRTIVITAIGAIVATPFFVPVFVSHPSAGYMIAFGFIGAIFGEAAFGIMPAYLSEQYPTEIRATGSTGTYNLGQIIAGWSTTLLASMFGASAISFEHGIIINSIVAFLVVIGLMMFGPRDLRDVNLADYDQNTELQGGGAVGTGVPV